MSIRFSGGERFQRGRGIGGLLRIAKNLFQPIVRTIGRAVKSNTGRAIGNALKEQVIESGTNLAKDIILGNDLKEGVNREVNTFKERVAEGIEQVKDIRKNRNRNSEPEEEEARKPKRKQIKKINTKYLYVKK